MALNAEAIADLIATTLKKFDKPEWTNLTTTRQNFVALPKILKKDKVEEESGTAVEWRVQIGNSGAAQNIGLYATITPNVGNTFQTASVPWRNTTSNYSFDRREFEMNRDPSRIVNLIKGRRLDCLVSLAELLETNFWGQPSSSTDVLTPYGILYWIVYNATDGFTGGNNSNWSAGPGGLSASTYTQWCNYCATYTNITKADLIVKWRKAATLTNFVCPVPSDEYPLERKGHRYGFYCDYSNVLNTLETLLEAQNDNLGSDLASQDGNTLFRKIPVTFVPQLEPTASGGPFGSTNQPIFGIDWSTFVPVMLKDEAMREGKPRVPSNQPSVVVNDFDLTWNLKCWNRRQQFLLATGAF